MAITAGTHNHILLVSPLVPGSQIYQYIVGFNIIHVTMLWSSDNKFQFNKVQFNIS